MKKTKFTSPPPKNIVISHVYSSDNKGDAALKSVLVTDLKRAFPRAKITILTLDSGAPNRYFESVPEKLSFMYYALNRYSNPLSKLTYTAYMVAVTLAWAVCWRVGKRSLWLPTHLRKVAALYAQADLVVPVGGGYIRSRSGLANRLNIPLLLHPLLFGYLLGKPTVLYSQSVGPFQNKFETWLVAVTLKRMTLILAREDTSLALLASLGVTENVQRAIDSGFLLRSGTAANLRKTYAVPTGQLLIGVTVRSWLTGMAQTSYEKAVAGALDNIVKSTNAHVIFIPQVTAGNGDDDRIVSARVHSYMHRASSATVITSEPDHHHIKAMYNELDALLGTRFHSVIFSLTSFVPVLAIEYEHKTSGIMHDLNLDEWVIKIEDVTVSRLTDLLHQLLRQSERYKLQLYKKLPPYIHQGRQTITLLQKSYDEAVQSD